jgi:hypothetical protein
MDPKTGLQKAISSIFNDKSQKNIIKDGSHDAVSAQSVPTQRNNSHDPSNTGKVQPQNTVALQSEAIAMQTNYADLVPVEISKIPKKQRWLKRCLPPFIAIVLAATFIVIIGAYMEIYVKHEMPVGFQTKPLEIHETVGVTPVIDWTIPEEILVTTRDLTQAVASDGSIDGKIIIKGILYSEERTLVIIGNRILKIGDTVAGATVMNIKRKTVEFMRDNKRWTQTVQ